MGQCHDCRTPLSLEVQRKNRLCPNCGSEIHCCKNCVNFDENLSSKCRESHSEWVSDRGKANSCTYFEFGPHPKAPAAPCRREEEAEKAKEAFRALFRSP